MKKNTIKLSELKEMIKHNYSVGQLNEKKDDDKEDEEDINIDFDDELEAGDEDEDKDEDAEEEDDGDEEMDLDDMDMDMDVGGGSGDADEILNLLIQAKNDAEGLNDPKLMRQLGNTITMITRNHIAKTDGQVPQVD